MLKGVNTFILIKWAFKMRKSVKWDKFINNITNYMGPLSSALTSTTETISLFLFLI